MNPTKCPCGGEAIVVRMGRRDFRVECTVCRHRNVGPCRTRDRAVRQWNIQAADRIAEQLYGKTAKDLTYEEAGELYGRLMRITEDKHP